MTQKMTEKQKFIRYVKLNFDLESKVSDLTQVEFKCTKNKLKLKLNINLLISHTISQYWKILKPIAQKYDLKNDLIVISDARNKCNFLLMFIITPNDELITLRDKLMEYHCRIVWWFLPNKIRRHYFQQTLSDHFGKAQVKEIMKTLSEEYHLF
jgi:hypothetical protein